MVFEKKVVLSYWEFVTPFFSSDLAQFDTVPHW